MNDVVVNNAGLGVGREDYETLSVPHHPRGALVTAAEWLRPSPGWPRRGPRG